VRGGGRWDEDDPIPPHPLDHTTSQGGSGDGEGGGGLIRACLYGDIVRWVMSVGMSVMLPRLGSELAQQTAGAATHCVTIHTRFQVASPESYKPRGPTGRQMCAMLMEASASAERMLPLVWPWT
jgi:hypothetical protein